MKPIASISTNRLLAISALFVSICALFVSIQHVKLISTQQKALMYPYLSIERGYNGEGFGLYLKNNGNGLARIHDYRVFNDSTYFKNWFELFEFYAPDSIKIGYDIIRTDGGMINRVVSPGEECRLIFLIWNENTRLLEKKMRDIQVEICYSSLIDDHWSISLGDAPSEINKPCIQSTEKAFRP